MTLLEKANNDVWYWHSKPYKLKDLDPKQLSSIKQTLLKSNNRKWFNNTRDYWLNAIKLVEKVKNKQMTNEAIDIILNNRIKKATLEANGLTNKIINCINKSVK